MPTLEQIQDEITSDSENLGYAGKAPVEVHALLNDVTLREYLVEPSTPDVANYLFNSQMSAALIAAKLSDQYAKFSAGA